MAIVKQRDSNLELLRIVAMSMIVIYHIIFSFMAYRLSMWEVTPY